MFDIRVLMASCGSCIAFGRMVSNRFTTDNIICSRPSGCGAAMTSGMLSLAVSPQSRYQRRPQLCPWPAAIRKIATSQLLYGLSRIYNLAGSKEDGHLDQGSNFEKEEVIESRQGFLSDTLFPKHSPAGISGYEYQAKGLNLTRG